MTIRLTEHKTLHHQRLIAFIFISIAAGIVGYFAIATNYFAKQVAEVEPTPEVVVQQQKNILYFSAQETGGENMTYDVYGYNVDTSEWSPVFESPYVYSSIKMLTVDYAAASLYDDTLSAGNQGPAFTPWLFSEVDSVYLPLQVTDYAIERDYTISQDDSYIIAYSVTNSDLESDDIYSLDNWSIILKDLNSNDENIEITSAARPQWINGSQLLYLKSDGIYTYDLVDRVESKVQWNENEIGFSFSAREELAANKDGSMLVVTSPGENQIIALFLNDENIYELYHDITSTDTIYSSPVFSPDGTHLALLTHALVSSPEATIEIQLFDLTDLIEPTQVLPLPDVYTTDSLELVGWTQTN